MKQPNTSYACEVCDGPAAIVEGVVARACGHDNAPVRAQLHAVTRGMTYTSADGNLTKWQRFALALRRVLSDLARSGS